MKLKSFQDITPDYRHIFLSPHFDDVVYSCGGTIEALAGSGQRPLVITVFAGIPSFKLNPLTIVVKSTRPLAFRVQRGMGFPLGMCLNPGAVVALRRNEDASAFDFLHADVLWLDYLDAIYRGRARRYTHLQQLLGGEIHPADQASSEQLALDLLALHRRLPGITWYIPLGIGRHIDHQLVSAAAGILIEDGATVHLYEDFPYVTSKGALDERLREFGRSLVPSQVEIADHFNQRVEAAALYASQLKMSFGDKAAMYNVMKDYASSIQPAAGTLLEQYWSPEPS